MSRIRWEIVNEKFRELHETIVVHHERSKRGEIEHDSKFVAELLCEGDRMLAEMEKMTK